MRIATFILPVVFYLFTACRQPLKEQPVVKEEAARLAVMIDSSILNNEPALFQDLLNDKIMSARIARSAGKQPDRSFLAGVKNGLQKLNFGREIINAMGEDGSYELVKHYEKDNIQHLVYRLYAESGLNYHDFELTKLDGKVYIGDIFIYTSGENFSKTIGDLGLQLMEKGSSFDAQDADAMTKVRQLISQGEFERADRLFQKLPASVRAQKMMQLIYLQIATGLGEKEYKDALDKFEIRFANEPNMNLVLIDAYFLRNEYEKALGAINELDAMIDKDPFLDYYRALVYSQQGKPGTAREYLEKLYANKPGFEDGVLELIANYCIAGQYDKAKTLVASYKQNDNFNQENLSMILSVYGGSAMDAED